MNSSRVAAMVREARISLGLTQSGLATLAGISLPTVQNIEAGRANPSFLTLQALFEHLGLSIKVESRAADWDAFAACGAPLLSARKAHVRPSRDLLLRCLREASMELASARNDDPELARKREAVQAVLLALKLHYPSIYEAHCRGRLLLDLTPTHLDGRLVKMKRQASAVLATYL